MTIKKSPGLLMLLALALLLFTFQRCTENQPVQTKTKLTITLSTSDVVNGRKQSNDLSIVKAVSISVVSSSGDEIFTHQRVNLTAFGDGFITDPIELPAGHYVLTDFFLLDASSIVMFATPHRASTLGVLPKQPLNRDFSVASGKTNTMAMEVVSVEGYSPEDFGYKSFSIAALNFFAVSVKIQKNGKSVFTTADGILLSGTDTLGIYKLGTAPKFIKFNGDTTADLELIIIKDGYGRFSRHFKFSQLETELQHKPLVVNLDPAITWRVRSVLSQSNYVEFVFSTMSDTLNFNYVVNYGDGSVLPISSDFGYASFYHTYPDGNGTYFGSITGSLSTATNFFIQQLSDFQITSLNLSAVPQITLYSSGLTSDPMCIVDLRENSSLTRLHLASGVLLNKNKLSDVTIKQDAANYLDYIIDNVYKNAVSNHTSNGHFHFSMNYYDDCTLGPIKIPTPEAKAKLKILQDIYHWDVCPSLDSF